MNQGAYAFYWTLPVKWAGFTTLPRDVDEAAARSRTIRYQREIVRRHARENGYDLLHEEVFMEVDPDRVSDTMEGPLESLAEKAAAAGARLLVVDFVAEKGWRPNPYLHFLSGRMRKTVEIVPPDPLAGEGFSFDPVRHFSRWRKAQKEWIDGKEKRVAEALEAARGLRARGLSYAVCARELNARAIPSLTGKPWNGDNLRKFMKKYGG